MLRNKRGVTIIALVITIIVLIILATVSVMGIIGNDSVVNKAKKSAEDTKYKIAEEEVKEEYYALMLDDDNFMSENMETQIVGLVSGLQADYPDANLSAVSFNEDEKIMTVKHRGYDIVVNANQWQYEYNPNSGTGGGYNPNTNTSGGNPGGNPGGNSGGSSGTVYWCTISFNSNGGSTINSASVRSGGYLAKPNDPTRFGFFFQGWYSDSELKAKYNFGAQRVYNDMTLYAKWVEIDYEDFVWGIAGTNKILLQGFSEFGREKYNAGSLLNLYIPTEHDGKKVTQIAQNAFKGCSNLESVNIPSTVSSIGDSAFENCTNMYSLVMPISINLISSSNVFKGDTHFTNITFIAGEGTTGTRGNHYNVGGESWKLTPWYYSRENNLTIEIDSGVTKLGDYMFYDCTGLQSVTLPNTLTEVGNYTFGNCTKLSSIIFDSSSLQKISEGAFYNCQMMDLDAGLMSNITEIGKNAFFGCTSLTELDLRSTEKIGENAFQGCTYLELVTSLKNLKRLEANVFNGCIALDIDTWPEAIEYIGDNAFLNCNSLQGNHDMTWLKTVETVGANAFQGCPRLGGDVNLSNAQTIGSSAFKNCTGLSGDVNLSKAKTISTSAFQGCTGITGNLNLSSAEEIGESAFQGCTGISGNLTMPNVKTIGKNAFNGNTAIKALEFSEKITTVGAGAFSGCTNIQSVKYPGTYNEKLANLQGINENSIITGLGQTTGIRVQNNGVIELGKSINGDYKIDTSIMLKKYPTVRNRIWNTGNDDFESAIITSSKKLNFTNNGDLAVNLVPVYEGKTIDGNTAEHNGFYDTVSQQFFYSEGEEYVLYGIINTNE